MLTVMEEYFATITRTLSYLASAQAELQIIEQEYNRLYKFRFVIAVALAKMRD